MSDHGWNDDETLSVALVDAKGTTYILVGDVTLAELREELPGAWPSILVEQLQLAAGIHSEQTGERE